MGGGHVVADLGVDRVDLGLGLDEELEGAVLLAWGKYMDAEKFVQLCFMKRSGINLDFNL